MLGVLGVSAIETYVDFSLFLQIVRAFNVGGGGPNILGWIECLVLSRWSKHSRLDRMPSVAKVVQTF